MSLRETLTQDLKAAMKAQDKLKLSTLRLIGAAIKDRDIALRGEGEDRVMTDAEILAVLAKMIKQRQDSAAVYEEGGRIELAEQERGEIAIIEGYLPRQLSQEEVTEAVSGVIAAVGASSIRDMGPVMAELKSRYTGQMDFAAVGPLVKSLLSAPKG